MAGTSIIEKLAQAAAEKRAYGWMYGGGMMNPYLGGMMNPYLGGMGYGGRWGGYGGFGGGYGGYGGGFPMMGQSYATPYGRGGYYGMDPMARNIYGLSAMQGLDQSQQMFEHGVLPSMGINLQGQQLEVDHQRQNAPAFQHAKQLEGATLARDLADPTLADPTKSSLLEEIKAQRALAEERQKRYEQMQNERKGIIQRHQQEVQALEDILGKLAPNSSAYNQMLTAAVTDPKAQDAMVARGFAASREEAKKLALENTSGFGRGWRRTMPSFLQAGDTDWAAALTALEKLRKMQGGGDVKGTHAAELEAQTQQEAAARAAYEEAQTRYNELMKQQQQMEADRKRVLEERAQHGTQNLQNVRGRSAGTLSNTESAASGGLTNPVKPGDTGARPVAPSGPTTTATPPPRAPAPLPTATPPLSTATKPAFTPPPTPDGPQGPRGPIKVASLVELVDMAARIHLEQQREKSAAGLGDLLGGQQFNVPGSQTRTGRGKRIVATPDLMENLRKSVTSKPGLPSVAKTVQPKLDTSAIMQSLGLQGMPASMAHLPVESAVSMGMTAEQHAKLRQMLGLG